MSTGSVRDLIGDSLLMNRVVDDGDGEPRVQPEMSSSHELDGKHVGLLFSRAFVPACFRPVL